MKKLLTLALTLTLVSCVNNQAPQPMPFNEHDFARGGVDAPLLNERTLMFMEPSHPMFGANEFRPLSQEEMADKYARWNNSRVETRWQEYHGTMVRVEVLRGSRDMREMRLKVIQGTAGGHVGGDNAHILGRVAQHEMHRICGRRSTHHVIIFDRPSFEVVRPTPFFDFTATDRGGIMREYGFRCIFN